jgi:V8-like Glu-specific endopeptidase
MLPPNQHLGCVELSGEASDSSMNESIIGEGQDARNKVDHTTIWSYSLQGPLSVGVNQGRFLGSGTFIGPNLALTCTHNLYQRDISIEYDMHKMSIYPGMNRQNVPYLGLKVIEV